MELSCVEVSELMKTPFFRRGKIGLVVDVVVMVQELLRLGVRVFT
jgi:hypothetical protein